MKPYLSITFSLLIVAGTGWFVSSGLSPVNHGGTSAMTPPAEVQQHRLAAGDAAIDQVSTRDESGMIQASGHLHKSAGNPGVSSPPLLTVRVPATKGLSSPPAKESLSICQPRSFSGVNQSRPTTASNERTRSNHSFASVDQNRTRQRPDAQYPSKPPVSSANPEKMKPTNPENVESSGTPEEDLTAAGSVADKVPEDQVVAMPNTPQPAVWVDLGATSSLSQDKQDEIQGLAESLSRQITESGLDPASPEYKQLWDEAVVDSDQLFRQRYGNQAWLEHHIQAYHLAHSTEKQGP